MSADLQRRAYRALDRVRGKHVAICVARDLVFVREGHAAVVIPGAVAPVILLGLGLGALLAQIELERPFKSPHQAPVLILIDSMASVVWIEAPVARAAGAA